MEDEPHSRPMTPTEQVNLMMYIERIDVGPMACERDFEVIHDTAQHKICAVQNSVISVQAIFLFNNTKCYNKYNKN